MQTSEAAAVGDRGQASQQTLVPAHGQPERAATGQVAGGVAGEAITKWIDGDDVFPVLRRARSMN